MLSHKRKKVMGEIWTCENYVSDKVVKKIKRHRIKHGLRWMYKEEGNTWDLLFIFIYVIYNIFLSFSGIMSH